MTLVFPKPKDSPRPRQRGAITIYPDGREVCRKVPSGNREYKRRIEAMWERQGQRCGLMLSESCRRRGGFITLQESTFEHVDGRGMNGWHRDDRIEKNGEPYNLAACWSCNGQKGSRRLQ